jgi:hypothetical protein
VAPAPAQAKPEAERRLQLGFRLRPEDHAAQPLFSNFTAVQGAPGMVFIDFGFLEPNVLPSVLRLAQDMGKVPEAVDGRLATRVVLGADAALQLAQQLQGHLRSLQAPAARALTPEVAPS